MAPLPWRYFYGQSQCRADFYHPVIIWPQTIKLLFPLVVLLASPGIRCVISPDDCVNPRNEIIRENCRPGNDSREWDVNADGDPSIQVRKI